MTSSNKRVATCRLAPLELRKFTVTWLPLLLHRIHSRVRRPVTCPCEELLKIAPFTFPDDLDRAVIEIRAHPVMPRARACSAAARRKKTPCTRPETITRSRAGSSLVIRMPRSVWRSTA
jgi:hypothetical protein